MARRPRGPNVSEMLSRVQHFQTEGEFSFRHLKMVAASINSADSHNKSNCLCNVLLHFRSHLYLQYLLLVLPGTLISFWSLSKLISLFYGWFGSTKTLIQNGLGYVTYARFHFGRERPKQANESNYTTSWQFPFLAASALSSI